jgi:endonuclease G
MTVMKKGKKLAALLLALTLSPLFGCGRAVQRLEQIGDRVINRENEPHQDLASALPLGNPSRATADAANRNNFLILRDRYAASYNDARGTPNWVAWSVTLTDLGEALPRPDFRPDPDLPFGFRSILPTDYSGSGYDRGHMTPSADRFGNLQRNEETFYMTNIVPQAKGLNQFPWQKLESYTRTLVRKGYDVYVIAGVSGDKGRIKRRVTIPASCWKILYIIPRGGSLLDAGAARVIAVEMPNDDGVRNIRWIKFKTTVRALEQKTGYDFFSALPPAEQDRLEMNIEQLAF